MTIKLVLTIFAAVFILLPQQKISAQEKANCIKVYEKKDKLLELKNSFQTASGEKKSVSVRIENTAMSKGSAALLGGGIGLVAGGLIGGVIASTADDDNPIDEGLSIGGGIVLGGLSGAVAGAVIGYLLGN